MTPTQNHADPASPARSPREGGRSPFRREIALTLLLKLVLLIAIKALFFSHPVSKQESAARLGAVIDGSAGSVSALSITSDQTEKK